MIMFQYDSLMNVTANKRWTDHDTLLVELVPLAANPADTASTTRGTPRRLPLFLMPPWSRPRRHTLVLVLLQYDVTYCTRHPQFDEEKPLRLMTT